MIHARLSAAAQWSGAIHHGQDTEFTGIAIDSRQVTPGSLFVALTGAHHDGHDYLDDAKLRRASCALVNHPVTTSLPLLIAEDAVAALGRLASVWRRSFQLPVIGVLGSNGKTTVKELITTILQQQYGDAVLATQGNQNNALGVPLSLFRLNSRYSAAVLELGASEQGEIAYLGEIVKPDVAVITNAGLDHIVGFGGQVGAARANGEVFASMNDNGIAVLNGDDECLAIWRQQAGARLCMHFGFTLGADVLGNWQPSFDGGVLTIESPWGRIQTRLHLMGRHNAMNALAAAAACLALDIEPEAITEGLAKLHPVAGRLKVHVAASGACIIDDTYNANPSSLAAALDALADMPGTKLLVLGDMAELGDEAEIWHGWAGQAARTAGVAGLFAVGSLTRLTAESFGDGAQHLTDSRDLSKALRLWLRPGVNVLVKGSRCMMMEKIVSELLQLTR
ncbi:UDP-N-acetylmuramoyl-tripeptide--D-alanyl-D-alanine ligase [Methylobacter sp.]|uniref:UDP-N-acetylmuramoyl-tripeptide--D-alanyl-D- alanine ligase n=1 Tax=Methylobacter sp. TaxID=2051955 RepID=UPI0024888683|nr:UDP-N-acetylmuramoyl-tripeptide--D-alanyl-D-alanine ligase [Methylobacter sp.]MDI1276959.1 UDP-N-acetylmuramoyl-tripeptide--D-alanyl-D-alanine ligase [Methylobacter sp.]MDI1357579.1 UDP-N-acetylmuramoyl-tripeptide--D-alanyl-D-alanine ligase [Methylobacter sp.]